VTKASDPTVDDLLVELVKVKDKFAWKLSENCATHEYDKHTSKLPFTSKDCETLDIFIFSAHPPLFAFTNNTGGYIYLLSAFYTFLIFFNNF